MSESPKRYWMSVVERDSPGLVSREAENGDPDFTPTRRSFLKAAGFSFAGAGRVELPRAGSRRDSVRASSRKASFPGRPLLYATTCGACEARCGLLVTTRDGRPVKIEGNPDHPFSGGVDVRGRPGVDSRSVRQPAAGVSDQGRPARDLGRCRHGDRRDARAAQAGRPRRPDPDADDHQPDDRGAHRGLSGRIHQRAARHLRSDLGVGGARRARADPRRAR